MTKTPNTTPQPNYPDQIISDKPQPGAEHAVNAAPISANVRRMPGLSEQDAGLLEQAASMLEGLHNDERNRGNCSTAEGAACSADAVRRLAVQLLRATPPAPAAANYSGLLNGCEPVAGQCRFVGDAAWLGCAAEHVRAVLAAPQDWEGYEVRYLYVELPPPPTPVELTPLTVERIRQLDDATKFHESPNWSVRFARAVEADHGIKEPTNGQQT